MRQEISEALLSMVQEELTSCLFHNPNKPPLEVLVLVQNQFEKQMNSLPNWFKTKPGFSETNSPLVTPIQLKTM